MRLIIPDAHPAGVYAITNVVTGEQYVGASTELGGRYRKHVCLLRGGKHHSKRLQSSWAEHGEDAFTFKPLLICGKASLLFYERRVMDALEPAYNSARVSPGHYATYDQMRRASQEFNTTQPAYEAWQEEFRSVTPPLDSVWDDFVV